MRKPFVLVICDGWGYNPESFGNAIAQANTPNFDKLLERWPHTVVEASGEAVGLPAGQMGNSEVGHLTIGTGRIIRQALSRQHHEIKTGSFFENETLITAIELAKQRGTALHIMGLISPGGVHSHQDSAVALVKMAADLGLKDVHVHAFSDGRDTKPSSARAYVQEFEEQVSEIGVGKVRSVSGRYFAMDRDNRWDRTQRVYDMLTAPEHVHHPSAVNYIDHSYENGTTDEFLEPVAIADSPADRVRIEDGDVVVFFNFRPDRARQLTRALVDADFKDFKRNRIVRDLHLVTFSEYDSSLGVPVAFPSQNVDHSLAEIVSHAGLHQYHVAETEKYAHVTYFINGGREEPFNGEDRKLIPSPKVAYYDEAPEMSARAVTDDLVARLNAGEDDLLIVNYANADMVGHTGNLEATKQAIECLDGCLADVVGATLAKGGSVLMTADHGNAEYKIDPQTNKPLTAHTTSPVPVVLCGTEAKTLRSTGGLADVAPTVLAVMGLDQPHDMSGQSLIDG